jgi:hypothetical protein
VYVCVCVHVLCVCVCAWCAHNTHTDTGIMQTTSAPKNACVRVCASCLCAFLCVRNVCSGVVVLSVLRAWRDHNTHTHTVYIQQTASHPTNCVYPSNHEPQERKSSIVYFVCVCMLCVAVCVCVCVECVCVCTCVWVHRVHTAFTRTPYTIMNPRAEGSLCAFCVRVLCVTVWLCVCARAHGVHTTLTRTSFTANNFSNIDLCVSTQS